VARSGTRVPRARAGGRGGPGGGVPLTGGIPAPPFTHLLALSDGTGIFEHARGTTPRVEHGYCTDDVARAVVVLLDEERRSPELEALLDRCLDFVLEAELPSGRFRNRRAVGGAWLDDGGSDDTCARGLLALARAARAAPEEARRAAARAAFSRAARRFRSPWPRPNALAVLSAVARLEGDPADVDAHGLLERALAGLGEVGSNPAWPWPEPRLAWGNALLPEARLAAGRALADDRLLAEGVALLRWLVGVERRGDHFSFTPVGGWAPGEARPGFDQQPIEAGAMALACERAHAVTGDRGWRDEVVRAAAWFLGENDVGVPLFDPVTGGCRDGLHRDRANENEGAESTLALIAAFQAAARSAATTSAATTLAAPTQRSAAP
jgi:hypothetical protein